MTAGAVCREIDASNGDNRKVDVVGYEWGSRDEVTGRSGQRLRRNRARRPPYAEAGGHDDAGYLAALRQDGISYPNPGRAIAAAQAVCTCLANGEPGLGVIRDVETRNPGFNMDSASQFAVVSAKYYCPQQLSKSNSK